MKVEFSIVTDELMLDIDGMDALINKGGKLCPGSPSV